MLPHGKIQRGRGAGVHTSALEIVFHRILVRTSEEGLYGHLNYLIKALDKTCRPRSDFSFKSSSTRAYTLLYLRVSLCEF